MDHEVRPADRDERHPELTRPGPFPANRSHESAGGVEDLDHHRLPIDDVDVAGTVHAHGSRLHQLAGAFGAAKPDHFLDAPGPARVRPAGRLGTRDADRAGGEGIERRDGTPEGVAVIASAQESDQEHGTPGSALGTRHWDLG